QDVRQRGVQLIRDRYSDFGPTLAREKLAELHHIKISRETLRKWMMDEGRWKGRKRKAPKLFHLRARRPQFGDLVQIDGSPHDWLEDRAPRCTLINFVDDATGKILYARF
ncbi:MAG: transposase, partial [Myxococcota bacterium]